MIFKIGMVEDNHYDANSIMVSLNENSDCINEESFKIYDLKKSPELRSQLFHNIERDIIENEVQCIIVDYKLDTLKEVLEGIEIVNYLHEKVPEFPVVILTNVPERGKQNDDADPDKVYPKKIFMKPRDEETAEMVYHIERNMERYAKKRADLELRQQQLLDKIVYSLETEDNVYGELLEIERELSRYVPISMNIMDEVFDMDDMEKALTVLQEYKKILG